VKRKSKLHVPLRRADFGLSRRRPRQAHRRTYFGSERRLLRESAGNPRPARPRRRLRRNQPRIRVPLQPINPDLLESKIKTERRFIEADFALLWEEESNRYRAPLTPGLVAVLKDKAIQWEAENASRKNPVPAQESAARNCEAVVLSGLEENRAQTADLHRRRDFRLSRSLIHHYEQLPY